jgi:hypothetical protein
MCIPTNMEKMDKVKYRMHQTDLNHVTYEYIQKVLTFRAIPEIFRDLILNG